MQEFIKISRREKRRSRKNQPIAERDRSEWVLCPSQVNSYDLLSCDPSAIQVMLPEQVAPTKKAENETKSKSIRDHQISWSLIAEKWRSLQNLAGISETSACVRIKTE